MKKMNPVMAHPKKGASSMIPMALWTALTFMTYRGAYDLGSKNREEVEISGSGHTRQCFRNIQRQVKENHLGVAVALKVKTRVGDEPVGILHLGYGHHFAEILHKLLFSIPAAKD